MHSPCHECPHRKLTCHDRCKEYLEFNEKRLASRNAFKGEHEAITFLVKGVFKRRKGAHIK